MSATRLPSGGEIDRDRPLDFRFDGRDHRGFAGDTIASALLASGVQLVGRSFKYHRPRGILAAGQEDPNAILDLRHGERHDPNARATLEPLAAGMVLHAVHAKGSAARDAFAVVDRFWRFIPAGFYYKTFTWPHWRLFEDAIRRMAGLGRLDPAARAVAAAPRHLDADVCIVGAGPAGLAAALAAQARGERVVLVEERTRPGGSLLWREATVEGEPGAAWALGALARLQAGGARVLLRATAIGLYDHGSVAVVERGLPASESPNGERLLLLRPARIVLATGALERPLLFADNDRPGVMLASAVLEYLRRFAVRCGERVVIAGAADDAWECGFALAAAGARCTLVDARPEPPLTALARERGLTVLAGRRVARALGAPVLTGVQLDDGRRLDADLLAVAGGWTPQIQLWCHGRARPRWDAAAAAFLPGAEMPGLQVVGAARALRSLSAALVDGAHAGGGESADAPTAATAMGETPPSAPDLSQAHAGRVWVDLQHDVTAKDIALAVRENFRAVEHLKRYTTLGMATDQGRSSQVNGIALLAAASGKAIGETGITTFRPPLLPVSMATLAGCSRGDRQAPLRRLPAESIHREEGAALRDYGNLLRPAWYGAQEGAIARECRAAREGVVVLDASSLGKIEVIGPQAAALLDFVFYNRVSTLAPGRLRYVLALSESGAVMDDGVVLRLAEEHFVVSCSSSHVAAMLAHLQEWREDRFELSQVFVHDLTAHWATIAISGPRARELMAGLGVGVPLEGAAFPHMSARIGRFADRVARIARVSFTGECCYEVSVPAGLAGELWQRARAAGASPLGLEALGVLRAEKGFIYVGQDTDAETMPQDIGMDGPRRNRRDSYVGDRALFTPAALRARRRQLVGLAAKGPEPLPAGAHALEMGPGGAARSIGFVTSSYPSVALGRPVALGLIEDGQRRMGEELPFEHLGQRLRAVVAPVCFLDPAGEKLRV